MIIREAQHSDWGKLLAFFIKIYRKNHPLQNYDFWCWQYGNSKFGRSFISLNDKEEIIGHVGASFGGGKAWIINVYLEEECRGKGILAGLYSLARNYYPLAATAANEAGLGLYRNMRWFRYHDLVRYVKINPKITNRDIESVCGKVEVDTTPYHYSSCHYFQQPDVVGLKFEDGSTAVNQSEVGGLRCVDVCDVTSLENYAWELGYNWLDYITSWNDLKIKELESNGWVLDNKSIVPWRLNPIEKGYFSDITFLSEEPLDKNFIVHRSFSDHGRIGSI